MIEILLYLLLGMLVGIILGLIPGLHPNMIALIIPVILVMNIETVNIVIFAVALAVSNTFLDFIPSMLLGAPEPGKELILLPAHRMLVEGNGYDAVKLAVIGGLGSVIFLAVTSPLIVVGLPALYFVIKPFTYGLLIFITLVIILSEKNYRVMAVSTFCFLIAGVIGIASSHVPVDRTMILFPILSGMFGVGTLILGTGNKTKIPKRRNEIHITSRQRNRSVIFGSLGGIFSGMLPGVGSSEIATIASVDKNEKSFIMTVGAVTISNTVMAILAIWLIQKPRSGIAVFISQLTQITFNDFLVMLCTAIFVAGVSAMITLKLAKIFISSMGKINYSFINKCVIALIVIMTFLLTGVYGLLVLFTCTALGIFVNLYGVRRSVLMGVLILPTIIFYLPF